MTNRSLRIDRASPRQILARILEEPSLVATVQNLAPRTLGRLIDRVGLEDSSELISLATTEQIKAIFDDDLWKSDRPGSDPAFDADRFALWLEVMLEAGEDFVVQKLLELPEDLVTLALHRHILVLDIDQLQAEMAERKDAKQIDRALEGYMYEEFDEYQVISRRADGWDSIVSILTTLDKHDHALLARVLERCCYLSSEYIDDNGGLYDVLTSDEMVESDLAADREDRRAAEGFIAPSQAASFFALCRSTSPKDVVAGPRDTVTRAYFRELTPERTAGRMHAMPTLPARDAPLDCIAELERLVAELEGEELPRDARPVFLLEGKCGTAAGDALFKTALAALHERDSRVHSQRMEELAYLTNALVSGCAVDGRALRPFEAAVAVAATCNLGLEHIVEGVHARGAAHRAAQWLGRDGADKVFRVGWWLLHHEVSLATRSALAKSRLPDLAIDGPTRAVIEGLSSVCPLLVGALVHNGANRYQLDRQRQFVACKEDLERVRAFLAAFEVGSTAEIR